MDIIFADLVNRVISHYPVKVEKIYLLTNKGKKAVWSIVTDIGELIMKKVPFDENHIEFMIHAINYLKDNGIHTPGVIKNSSGTGYVKLDDEYYVVFEAVYGRTPEYEREDELLMVMRGMAAFHQASKGIESKKAKFPSFLLLKWKKNMRSMYENLLLYKEQRSSGTDKNEFDQLFLTHVDTFLKQCETAISMLDNPEYDKWVKETLKNKSLCHQDYAAANLAIGSDGNLYVFDMDSLTVDLPVRDIRKILNKVMKQQMAWDQQLMKKMMKAYQEIMPLTKKQYHILAADILFPHLFYGQVSKYYQQRDKNWSDEKRILRFKEIIATELTKETVLKGFLKQLEEVI